jgi:phosphoserine phosphatase
MPIYALVLTSPPDAPSLSALAVERAWSLIPGELRRSQSWLSPDEAWQAEFVTNEIETASNLKVAIAGELNGLTIDINILTGDTQTRRKKLLVADMDSTVIRQECIDEIADFAGVKDVVSAITERAMRGELDFAGALRERVSLLRGLPVGDLQRVVDERLQLMPGARTLVATMKANGAYCALVSGGFTFFTSRIAATVGFNNHFANTLETADGRLTGRVVEPILGREAKLAALQALATERGLQGPETLAVGDGANDLAMVKAAGLGVAFRAKPLVAAEADAAIIHGDLTALLYLQGYRRSEFVSG